MERLRGSVIKVILISLVSNSTFANDIKIPSCFKKKTHVHYINGVNTDFDESKATRILIEKVLGKRSRHEFEEQKVYRENLIHPLQVNQIDKMITYDFTYNQTHWSSLVGDLHEFAEQTEYLKSVSGRLKSEAVIRTSLDLDLRPLLLKVTRFGYNDLEAKIISDMINLRSSVIVADYRAGDTKLLTEELRRQLVAGNKVILVAHSQGNMFANEAYLRLFDSVESGVSPLDDKYKASFGILHVASPWASSFTSNSQSILLQKDLVIAGAAKKLESEITPNYLVTTVLYENDLTQATSLINSAPDINEETRINIVLNSSKIKVSKLPDLGHGVDSLYLSEFFEAQSLNGGESIPMAEIFSDSMNLVAQTFVEDCDAPSFEDDSGTLREIVSLENLKPSPRTSSHFVSDVAIDLSQVRMGFRILNTDDEYSEYQLGDIKNINLLGRNLGSEVIESFADGKVLIKDVNLSSVYYDESDDHYYFDALLKITDRFDQVVSAVFKTSICSGARCDFLSASIPEVSFEEYENTPIPKTCDGSYSFPYRKSCIYTISCDEGSPVVSFNGKLSWVNSSSPLNLISGKTYRCNRIGDSWVVESTTANSSPKWAGCMNWFGKVTPGSSFKCD